MRYGLTVGMNAPPDAFLLYNSEQKYATALAQSQFCFEGGPKVPALVLLLRQCIISQMNLVHFGETNMFVPPGAFFNSEQRCATVSSTDQRGGTRRRTLASVLPISKG